MRKKFLRLCVLVLMLGLKFIQSPAVYALYFKDDIPFKYKDAMPPYIRENFMYIAGGNYHIFTKLTKWYDNNIGRNYYRPNYVAISAIKHVVEARVNNLVTYAEMGGHDLLKHIDEIDLINRSNIVIKKLGGTDMDMIRIEYSRRVI